MARAAPDKGCDDRGGRIEGLYPSADDPTVGHVLVSAPCGHAWLQPAAHIRIDPFYSGFRAGWETPSPADELADTFYTEPDSGPKRH